MIHIKIHTTVIYKSNHAVWTLKSADQYFKKVSR